MNPAKKPASSGPIDTDLPSPISMPKPATMTGAKLPLVTCGTWLDVAPDSTPKYSPAAAETGIGIGPTQTMRSIWKEREKSRPTGKPRSRRKSPLV